ncbi:Cobalamin synthase [Geobacillus sp. BCO2]|nr:Cobalamin synthase [Geobacillus sp. BCO2]
MKSAWNGWLLALQLFTIIPIRRSIEWNAAHVRWLVRCMPLAGALIGALSAGVYALFSSFSFSSPLVWALLFLWLGIWMAGGMHADGFMDVSDAFFRTATSSGGKRSCPIRASARLRCCRLFVCCHFVGCFCTNRSRQAFRRRCSPPFRCCRGPGLPGFFPSASWQSRQEWRHASRI